MSKNKGFSNTSAQRYSLALYELSTEANSLDNIEQHSIAVLNLIDSSKDFNDLIKDPTENQENLIYIVNKISENFKLDNLLKNFMNFLIKKRRFFYIEKILKNFIDICSEKRGEVKGEIQSAKELSNEEINNHDKSLIGGLIVKIGSTMVDTSIKNKLQKIENKMIEA